MSALFCALADPCPLRLEELARLTPRNPFSTPAYAAFRQQRGAEPWILGLQDDGHLVAACLAFMRSGYLNRELEITSLPDLPSSEPFWHGVLALARQRRLTHLYACSFGSTKSAIPSLPGERQRDPRWEFVIELPGTDLERRLTTNHRRQLARARKAAVRVERVSSARACEHHAALVDASMHRRQERGEDAPVSAPVAEFVAMVQHGAGELFQAVVDGAVVSSMMVLRAARGGYLQSSGTSPFGMTCGASALVVHEVMRTLQSEGFEQFNLGGVGPGEDGLRRFKCGFGARAIDLEFASFTFASPMKQVMNRVVRRLRRAVGSPS